MSTNLTITVHDYDGNEVDTIDFGSKVHDLMEQGLSRDEAIDEALDEIADDMKNIIGASIDGTG